MEDTSVSASVNSLVNSITRTSKSAVDIMLNYDETKQQIGIHFGSEAEAVAPMAPCRAFKNDRTMKQKTLCGHRTIDLGLNEL